MSDSNVLVTGHTGFVGSALTKLLRLRGETVIGVSASNGYDLESPHSLNTLDGIKISQIYHLAGRTYVPESWERPDVFYRSNVLGTQTVLDFCRKHSLPMIHVSAYIYGHPQHLPVTEDHPLRPDNPYAHSKFLAEELCRFYADSFVVPVTIVRPFNIYGPGQPDRFLIPSLARQILAQETVTVANTVSRRDFIFVDDVADAILFLAKRQSRFSVYNICSGQSYSVEEIIEIISEILDVSRIINSGEIYRKNEVPNVVGSAARLLTTGWKPGYTFAQGLTATIDRKR
jgi:nucleoside-diphosphate-sugar epimerase